MTIDPFKTPYATIDPLLLVVVDPFDTIASVDSVFNAISTVPDGVVLTVGQFREFLADLRSPGNQHINTYGDDSDDDNDDTDD